MKKTLNRLVTRWSSLFASPAARHFFPAVAIVLIGVVGATIILVSRAAGSSAAKEAESGSLAGSASLVADATASGGQAVKFGQGSTAGYTLPLKVSPNQRYLVDQNDKPFFLNIDTAWTLLSWLPRAEADDYMDARKAQGFNAIMSGMTGWGARDASRNGVPAFTNGDLTQPNEAYFAVTDQIVQDAAAKGIVLLMGPWTLGDNGTDDPGGVPSTQEWASFGTYVGNRYKSYNNIIWYMGGDHDVQQTWDDTNDYTPYIDAMANGVKSADSRHLITYHPALNTFVLGNKSWFAFYAYQENRADSSPWQYDRTKSYYVYSPTKPVMSIEPGYETGDALTGVATTPYMVRRNAWWSFLSGAMGITYGGNRHTWNIGEYGAYSWQDYVNLDGAKQQSYIRTIMEKYNWQDLVPDFNHAALTGGYNSGSDYAAAGLAPDGSLFAVYTPGDRTLTVDMSKLSGTVHGYWYDPASGQVKSDLGTMSNSGSKSFSTPGSNSYGDSDYILILKK